jgi:hypothetical protein
VFTNWIRIRTSRKLNSIKKRDQKVTGFNFNKELPGTLLINFTWPETCRVLLKSNHSLMKSLKNVLTSQSEGQQKCFGLQIMRIKKEKIVQSHFYSEIVAK